MSITAIEMAEMDPPLADLHPLRALYLIPSNKPPTLASSKKWSKNFKEFLKLALVKDPKKRPTASQLLKHPFLKGPTQTVRKTRHIMAELIEKMVKQEGQGAKGEDDDDGDDDEEVEQVQLKVESAGGNSICFKNNLSSLSLDSPSSPLLSLSLLLYLPLPPPSLL